MKNILGVEMPRGKTTEGVLEPLRLNSYLVESIMLLPHLACVQSFDEILQHLKAQLLLSHMLEFPN